MLWKIVAIGFALILPIHGQTKSTKSSTHEGNTAAPTKAPAPLSPSIVNVINQDAPKQQEDGTTDHSKRYLTRLFSAENLPNILLFGAAVAGIIIAARTLRQIRDQATSGRDSARAALLSAQAVIDAERPWFVVSIEKSKPSFNFWRIRITNKGRTPGQLVELFEDRIFVDTPESLPLPPKYSSPTYAPDTSFFANGESFTIRETYDDDGFLPKDIWEQQSKTKLDFLVVYGKVSYKDTFTGGRGNEILHETRFCYLWQGPQECFVPCGPAEYNGYRDYQKEAKKAKPN